MPRNARPMYVFPIALREARVVEITDVTPHLRRLTLGGPDLDGGVRDGYERQPFVSLGFDDHVKLVVPDADGTRPDPGRQGDGRVEWAPGVMAFTRDYTVRSWDRARGTFDIEVVRHAGGRAAEWAFSAEVGSAIAFAGPKMSQGVVAEAEHHLLLADETGLPAVARWIDEADPDAQGRVIIEVPTPEDVQRLPAPAGVTVQWLVRPDGVRPGHSTLLLDALRALPRPAGRCFAWCAGETITVAPIRRFLRNEWGLPKEDVDVAGYWRRTESAAEAEDGADHDEVSPAALASQLHEMSELLPPVVLRVAATLDLATRISEGATTAAALAPLVDVPPYRLSLLLDAMTALGLLTRTDGSYANTPLGEGLCQEGVREDLDLTDPVNRAGLALTDLLDVLRTGVPSPAAALPASPDVVRAREAHATDALAYLAEPLAARPDLAGVRTVTVLGHGSAIAAAAVLHRHPDAEVTVVTGVDLAGDTAADLRSHGVAEALSDRVRILAQPSTAPLPMADAVIGLFLLDGVPDETAVQVAARLAGAARRTVLVVTHDADEAASDDHAAAATLTSLVGTGVALRTRAETAALLGAAGLDKITTGPLGWGFGPSLVAASQVASAEPTGVAASAGGVAAR